MLTYLRLILDHDAYNFSPRLTELSANRGPKFSKKSMFNNYWFSISQLGCVVLTALLFKTHRINDLNQPIEMVDLCIIS